MSGITFRSHTVWLRFRPCFGCPDNKGGRCEQVKRFGARCKLYRDWRKVEPEDRRAT